MLLKYIDKLIAIFKIMKVWAHILTWSVPVFEENFKMEVDIFTEGNELEFYG
jgi:hypothetical protein